MRKERARFSTTVMLIAPLIALMALLLPGKRVFAQIVYENSNGYEVSITDKAELLSEQEEESLLKTMQPITAYGNVAFYSVGEDMQTLTKLLADRHYQELWGNESGTVFVIDMANRMLYIHSVGTVYDTLKTSYANTITDNVYTYATKEDYALCATNAYEQIYTVLEGGRIAQPMKYISNALFAFMLSFVLLYLIVKMVSKAKKPSKAQLFNGLKVSENMENLEVHYVNENRTYIPVRDGDFWLGILEVIFRIGLALLFGGGGGGSRSSSSSRSSGSKGGGGHRF